MRFWFVGETTYFNPRSPYGERHSVGRQCINLIDFNPRSPYGERLAVDWEYSNYTGFQSTLPIRRATLHARVVGVKKRFQSTLPIRRATTPCSLRTAFRSISIHAPHTESDPHSENQVKRESYFNPRSPYGERLLLISTFSGGYRISIHAPHTESDVELGSRSGIALVISIHAPHTESDNLQLSDLAVPGRFQSTLPIRRATTISIYGQPIRGFQSTLPIRRATQISSLVLIQLILFQSTLPIRRATIWVNVFVIILNHFNPRSPYGERPSHIAVKTTCFLFQSTLPIRRATSYSSK